MQGSKRLERWGTREVHCSPFPGASPSNTVPEGVHASVHAAVPGAPFVSIEHSTATNAGLSFTNSPFVGYAGMQTDQTQSFSERCLHTARHQEGGQWLGGIKMEQIGYMSWGVQLSLSNGRAGEAHQHTASLPPSHTRGFCLGATGC